jgi:hypothetical protein
MELLSRRHLWIIGLQTGAVSLAYLISSYLWLSASGIRRVEVVSESRRIGRDGHGYKNDEVRIIVNQSYLMEVYYVSRIEVFGIHRFGVVYGRQHHGGTGGVLEV